MNMLYDLKEPNNNMKTFKTIIYTLLITIFIGMIIFCFIQRIEADRQRDISLNLERQLAKSNQLKDILQNQLNDCKGKP
jgi:hypothetical protein